MTSFAEIEKQLTAFSQRHPEYSLSEALLVRLIRMLDKLMADNAHQQLRKYGLSLTEYNTLTMLEGSADGLTVSEVVALTGEKPSNITRVTDQLFAKGLLERRVNPQDRRVWLLSLNDDGRALLRQLLPDISQQLRSIFAGVDQSQRDILESSLKSLLASVSKEIE